jgi:Arc/MetJ-type ribon-helix-helix transcriptional regulator
MAEKRMKLDYGLPEGVQKELEVLIAMGLYKTKSETMKDYLRKLSGEYRSHLRPIEEVRKMLGEEIPSHVELSQEILDLRKRETH